MAEREEGFNPGKINEETWRASGLEYIIERQKDLLFLLGAAVTLKKISSSEIYTGELSKLLTDEAIEIVSQTPPLLIFIASIVQGELEELKAMTPEIKEQLETAEDIVDSDYFEAEEIDNPEDPPTLPFNDN